MKTKYQIIYIGENNSFLVDILNIFYRHIEELGLKKESLIEINENNFKSEYKANAPSFCLYFGSSPRPFKNLDILKLLQQDATLILPVVKDLKQFSAQIPEDLKNINGFELASVNDIEKLVSCILEGLSLLRLSRRLFISYKRNESSTVAIQLFEQFEKNGFDVFLDTHSIRPGEPFQDELWHRMADTDVVVILNTPGFLTSEWTQQELAKANAMSIGIVQLIWPNHTLEINAQLSMPVQLNETHFGNLTYGNSKSYLTDNIIEDIIDKVETLRARSLAARQDNIITEFISSSIYLGKKANLQPEKFIVVRQNNGEEVVVIPTVGVPEAFTYNQSEELVNRIKESKSINSAWLLYDHNNIREKWLNHLAWLDNYLPIKTLRVINIEKWLKTI